MMVTFISQCQKKALNRTRRVLDAFANRIGDNTWQTIITQEGLQAVQKLLRKTATKNTAVSCHWIRSRSRSELIWVVGNRRKFNQQGVVPVNMTMESKQIKEQFLLNTHVIALLSSLAGFFHDVGKSNELFQNKLKGNSGKSYECYRHEWVSLRLFQAFVDGRSDTDWLNDLANIDNQAESRVIEKLASLQDGVVRNVISPFNELSPVAHFVAWLIVSHHKLPIFPESEDKPDLLKINEWQDTIFEAAWNSPQVLKTDWSTAERDKNWHFPHGTPFISVHWQTQISILARRVLRNDRIFLQKWTHQRYTAHLARLALMLSDHYYSSNEPNIKITPEWQDRNYGAFANTYTDIEGKKQLKQKLDEHNIAVGIYAEKIAKQLPNLRNELPVFISKELTKKTEHEEFEWQNEAYNLAKKIKDETKQHGFFGICKASTGKGKTLGNARIMYGLSDDETCRFNIALGLRTLTLQTAKALEKDLNLKQDQIVTLIGSQVVKELHQQDQASEAVSQQEQHGSLSSEPLLKDDIEVLGGANDYIGDFDQWIDHDPKIKKLIQAPLLVSTIDYLIPATEGVRGGRQIAPMLRLLTSDLVIDEPDDFGLEDLPALCRLLNWVGMLGNRVLLSTATMPPSLASALFCAYQAGRKHYTEVNGEQGVIGTVCCAWFDEFKEPKSSLIADKQAFEIAHQQFVEGRVANLTKYSNPLRKAKLIDISLNKDLSQKPTEWMVENIQLSISQLHQLHALNVLGKRISIGLVRFANIDPLVQVSKHLLNRTPDSNTIIHYCIYHGQFPLIQRSTIEKQLDAALNRKDEDHWVKHSGLTQIVNDYQEMEHIFVVLATSVAEVGRDHDYDWAIVEPSSMRSIIQLAGRIQRHRKAEPTSENMHILSTNYKGLTNQRPNFIRPGFETTNIQLSSNNLFELDVTKQIESISAIPRIQTLDNPKAYLTDTQPPRITSFNALEHLSQAAKLFGSKTENNHASLWWQTNVSWCGELQARQPFRQSALDDDYCLFQPSHANGLRWHEKVPKTYPAVYQLTEDIASKPDVLSLASGVTFWIDVDIEKETEQWLDKYGGHPEHTAKKLTHISLRKLSSSTEEQWQWHSNLGVYKRLKKDKWSDDE